jgi:hypothetical protein
MSVHGRRTLLHLLTISLLAKGVLASQERLSSVGLFMGRWRKAVGV